MTTTTTASLLETRLFRCDSSSSSFKLKCKFESPAKTRLLSPATGKHVVRSLRALRVRCASDDPGSRPVFISSRRKMVVLLSTVQLLSHLLPPNGKAADIYPVMQNEIRKVVTKGKAAGVLRLVFHDAGTFELDDNSGGINGSIAYELERPENTGLKKSLKVLAKAKTKIDEIQPVSWADMISVAGSEAVSICGGPTIPVVLGRLDSVQPDPEGKLPPETLSASGLKECFKRKGFSTQELVALSGAHTLGSKGFGDPTVFDNAYYKILLEKPWTSTCKSHDEVLKFNSYSFSFQPFLTYPNSRAASEEMLAVIGYPMFWRLIVRLRLYIPSYDSTYDAAKMTSMVGLPSDHALVEDDECIRLVQRYAEDQDKFFRDFTDAYIKLVNSGAKWNMDV